MNFLFSQIQSETRFSHVNKPQGPQAFFSQPFIDSPFGIFWSKNCGILSYSMNNPAVPVTTQTTAPDRHRERHSCHDTQEQEGTPVNSHGFPLGRRCLLLALFPHRISAMRMKLFDYVTEHIYFTIGSQIPHFTTLPTIPARCHNI